MKLYEQTIALILEHTTNPEIIERLFETLEHYDYAFIGGFAVSFYSEGRRKISLNDLDLMILASDTQELKSSFAKLGFNYKRENDFGGKQWLIFSYKDQELDVALADDSLSKQGIQKAKSYSYHGYPVKIVDASVLVTMKIEAGREKDHTDILYILKSQKNQREALKLVQKFVPERVEELEQLIDDSKGFDYDLLDAMSASPA